ncbi:hypothetical protein [Bradyrhizobium sp. ORS 111]|uniref:hypothetical protein n=1 Tax=Bradyrhizobium sp. ORS 111 TaxID=1685958 RepID=UPI0038900BC7
MGQAKLRQKAYADILAGHPSCIYCAGASVATTIEHMPPIQMFEGRQRPKGLEYPACTSCNNGTGRSDLVASMLARALTSKDTEVHRRDLQKVLSAVANNVPGVLQEMRIARGGEKLARKRHGIPPDMHPLRVDGPLLTQHILIFAAKLGFALHYETTGTCIPLAGGVQVMWFSNLQAMNGAIPQELFNLLPAPSTLQQGIKSVGDQFQYALAQGEQDHLLYFASFNRSFAVAGITATDRSIWLESYADRFPIYAPGSFRSADVCKQ